MPNSEPERYTQPKPIGLIRRLVALIYDSLLLFGILFLATLIIVAPYNLITGNPLELTSSHPLHLPYLLYLNTIAFVFFGWFWTHGGQTLGMRTWRIRVVRFDGHPLTWAQALSRFCLAVLSGLLLGIGFIWALFNAQRLTLHDQLTKTHLVESAP